MISIEKVKEKAKKENKRISKKAIKKLCLYLEATAREMIKKASKNADFSGRKTIKEEDIAEE